MKIQNKLNIHGGEFARPTKFTAMVFRPPLISNGSETVVDVLCKTVNIPEITHEPIPIMIKGHKVSVPGRTNQSQIFSMVFYVDEGYDIRRLFQEWIDAIDDRYYAPSIPPFELNQDKYGKVVVLGRDYRESGAVMEEFIFENAFPISIGDFEYSGQDKDSIIEMTVTFSFSRMVNSQYRGYMDNHDSYMDTPSRHFKSNVNIKDAMEMGVDNRSNRKNPSWKRG